MQTFKTNIKSNKDLQIWFSKLPTKAGQSVEVIVTPLRKSGKDDSQANNLSGTVLEYSAPFEPVISEYEWEALN
jgi:CRISPR/Cas system-associated endonuclease Cas3-HD